MFSSLLSRHRSGRSRRLAARNDSLSPPTARRQARQFTGRTHATADFTEADDDDDEEDDEFNEQEFSRLDNDDHQGNDDAVEEEDDDEDGDGQQAGGLPVLPLFSSSHLGT